MRCWGRRVNERWPGTEDWPEWKLGTTIVEYTMPDPETVFKYIAGYRAKVCAIKLDGSAYCLKPKRTGIHPLDGTFHEPQTHTGPYTALTVSEWGGNVCALKTDGTIECHIDTVGTNEAQLPSHNTAGLNNVPDNGVVAYTGVSIEDYTDVCGLREDKTIACWGDWSGAFRRSMPSFESPWRSNADLRGLRLDGAELAPGFSRGVTSYTASVASTATSVTVLADPTNSLAAITVASDNDSDVANDVDKDVARGVVDLAEGANVITVQVMSADDSTTKTYTVTITRAAS